MFFSLSRAIQASAICGIDSESHSASAGNFSAPGGTCVGSFQIIEFRALKNHDTNNTRKRNNFWGEVRYMGHIASRTHFNTILGIILNTDFVSTLIRLAVIT